jgi:hypothetical protein
MQRAKALIFMMLLCISLPASKRAVSQESPTFTLQLSVVSPKIQNGEEETVTVTMKNTSSHDILYGTGGPGPLFRLRVLDENGKSVKETVRGMKAHGTGPNRPRFTGSVFAASLKSGESVTDKIELEKEYDLSSPGVYRVSAFRTDVWTHTVVTSNEVLFTVLPK